MCGKASGFSCGNGVMLLNQMQDLHFHAKLLEFCFTQLPCPKGGSLVLNKKHRQSLRLCDDAPNWKKSAQRKTSTRVFWRCFFLVTERTPRDLYILMDFAKWEQVSFKSQIFRFISMAFVCLCFFWLNSYNCAMRIN